MAPGFLATSAMQMGCNLASHPIMGKVRWHDTYVSVLATPAGVPGIMLGEFGWIAVRLLQGSAIFAVVMVLFGAVRSPWVIAAAPVAALTGLAFATPISIISSAARNDLPFALIWTIVIFPMMMFGGALFPVSQLPGALQVLAWALPLAHGVALARALSIGAATPSAALLHLSVLVAYALAGGIVSYLAMRRRLEP
jgi:lipooligosaccharide transport system permease protein